MRNKSKEEIKINDNIKEIYNHILSKITDNDTLSSEFKSIIGRFNRLGYLYDITELDFAKKLLAQFNNSKNKNILNLIIITYFKFSLSKNKSIDFNNINEDNDDLTKEEKEKINFINKHNLKNNITNPLNLITNNIYNPELNNNNLLNYNTLLNQDLIESFLISKNVPKSLYSNIKSGVYLFISKIINDLKTINQTLNNTLNSNSKKIYKYCSKDKKKNLLSKYELITLTNPLNDIKALEKKTFEINKFYEEKIATTKENKEYIRENMSDDKAKNYILCDNNKRKKVFFDEDYEICKIINKIKLDKAKGAQYNEELNKEDQNEFINIFMDTNKPTNILEKRENNNQIEANNNTQNNDYYSNNKIKITDLLFYLNQKSNLKKSKYYYKYLIKYYNI